MLREHSGVSDCVVLGVPDDALRRAGRRRRRRRCASRARTIDGSRSRRRGAGRGLAGYKRPRRFFLVDTLRPLRRGQGRLPLPQGSREPDARHVGVRRRCRRIRCRESRPRSGRVPHAWPRTARRPRPPGAPRRRSRGPGSSRCRRSRSPRRVTPPPTKAERTRSATRTASRAEQSGSTTANSSPPRRAARSDAFVRRTSASATVRSTASPAGWPALVVDGLEVVDVEHQEAHRARGPSRARDLEGQRLLEQAPVREPGQMVAGGEELDLVEQRPVAQRRARRARPPARASAASSSRMPGPAAGPPFGGEDAVARSVGADRERGRR